MKSSISTTTTTSTTLFAGQADADLEEEHASREKAGEAVDVGGNDEEEEDEEEEYEVEAIIKHKASKSGLKYFLKWKGYPDSANEWSPEENLFCNDLVIEYWTKRASGLPPKDSRAHQLLQESGLLRKRRLSTGAGSEDEQSEKSTLSKSKKKSAPTKSSSSSVASSAGSDHHFNHLQQHQDSMLHKSSSADGFDQPIAVEMTESVAKTYGLSYKDDSWEEKIDRVETMEQTESGVINVYFYLKQKEFAVAPVETAHKFFPKLMLQFYLSKLKFTRPDEQ